MTIEQIRKNIQAMEQNLAEMKARLVEFEQPDDGKPKKGDTYLFLTGGGYSMCIWDGYPIDEAHWKRGNVYKTEADAVRADMKRIVTAKLQRIADKYPPCDWGDQGKEKYYIYYSCYNNKWEGECSVGVKSQGTIYASDERYVEEALALGDELNVLLEA